MTVCGVPLANVTAVSTAWLLVLNNGWRVAVSEAEMRHLLHRPTLFNIPCSPVYCSHVLIWEEKLVPVFDLAAWLTAHKASHSTALIGVVAYREKLRNTIEYGALHLSIPPKRVSVHDDAACELPDDGIGWPSVAISCFADNDRNPIPILDMPRIFSTLPAAGAAKS